MNNEIGKDIVYIKENILEMKEEIFKLNNLVFDMIKELKINTGMKMESENSEEIDDILRNCLDNF